MISLPSPPKRSRPQGRFLFVLGMGGKCLFESYLPAVQRGDLEDLARELNQATHAAFGETRGACGIASSLLARELRSRFGAAAEIVYGCYRAGAAPVGHTWVEVDGYICDPTRDQFDDGPLVCPLGTAGASGYSRSGSDDNVEAVAAQQLFDHMHTVAGASGSSLLAERYLAA